MRVLLVEDSVRLSKYIKEGLNQVGYAVDSALDGEDGSWLALSNNYDVIILDLMLPKVDGISLLRRLRENKRNTHVLILTAKDTLSDKVHGLRAGADDYLVKPFAMEELIARVQSLVRRAYGRKSPVIAIGDLEIDTSRRVASRQGGDLELTAREYALLEYLAMKQGQVVSRTEIEQHIYDDLADPLSNVVDSTVYRLRKKVERPGGLTLIHTRRGMGYVLEVTGL